MALIETIQTMMLNKIKDRQICGECLDVVNEVFNDIKKEINPKVQMDDQ